MAALLSINKQGIVLNSLDGIPVTKVIYLLFLLSILVIMAITPQHLDLVWLVPV